MRELSLKQINSVVRKVTEGVNVGVGDGKIDVEKALSNALAGMDDALLKVVEANKGRAAETDRRWRELRGIERAARHQPLRYRVRARQAGEPARARDPRNHGARMSVPFSPIRLAGLELTNRICNCPVSRAMGNCGNDQH
jgi:hypothetical protein